MKAVPKQSEAHVLYRNSSIKKDLRITERASYLTSGVFTGLGSLAIAFGHPFFGSVGLGFGAIYLLGKYFAIRNPVPGTEVGLLLPSSEIH